MVQQSQFQPVPSPSLRLEAELGPSGLSVEIDLDRFEMGFKCGSHGKSMSVTHPSDAETRDISLGSSPRNAKRLSYNLDADDLRPLGPQNSKTSFATEPSESLALDGVEISGMRPEKSVKVSDDALAADVFDFEEKLGQGGYGEVWRCRKKATQQEFAIKRIFASRTRDFQTLEEELVVFRRLRNPYIVKLHEVYSERGRCLSLVMDLCSGGDLAQYLLKYWNCPENLKSGLLKAPIKAVESKDDLADLHLGLPEDDIGHFMWQMLAGITYMHHHRFVHRDIKLENYMLKYPGEGCQAVLQLADFGLSKKFSKKTLLTGTVGTIDYMAPEVLHGSYDEKCDIWSIGVVCYRLCTGSSPWPAARIEQETAQSILRNNLVEWRTLLPIPDALHSVVDLMMTWESRKRPSAKDILRNTAWLRNFGMGSEAARSRGEEGGKGCCAIS